MSESRFPAIGIIITILTVLMAIYQLISSQYVFFTPIEQQNIHLFFALTIIFLTAFHESLRKGKSRLITVYFGLLALLTIASTGYVQLNYNDLLDRIGIATPVDLLCGVILILLALESTRLTFGWTIPILTCIAVGYMFVGPWLPGILYHGGFSLERTISSLAINFSSGIYGTLLSISATFIALFMIFGGLLGSTGGSKFFMDLGMAIGGRFRSGPAQAAVVSSALMGSINGSAVANVATTGVFTIPMMKKRGYSPEFAGAVEAAASTGGMFLPPVMGVGAFVMAEITGISYAKIALSAAIPGLLYYLLIGATVQFRSAKMNLELVANESLPKFGATLKNGGIFLFPIVLIVYYFAIGYSPLAAGLAGIKVIVIIYFARLLFAAPRKILTWEGWKPIVSGLEEGIKALVGVAAILACVGIMVQSIIATGLAQRMISLVLQAGHNSFTALLIAMGIALFFGLGVPTTAAYVLLAVLAAPALVQIGLPLLPVHLFLYYYTIVGNVTPPVGSAAIVAARLADANYNRLCFIAIRLSLSAFILPFIFVYKPELLGQGNVLDIIEVTFTAAVGLVALSACFEGFLLRLMGWAERLIVGAVGIMLILPLRLEISILCLALLTIITVMQYRKREKSNGRA